jgi:hypothetical protein
VKVANKRFTSIKNDLCITFDKNSSVEEVEDDSQIQTQGYRLSLLPSSSGLDTHSLPSRRL